MQHNENQAPDSNNIYAVMFKNSLKVSKSPNHPQLDVFGNVLSCPILLAARANNPNWSNQWVASTLVPQFPNWIVENPATVASRNRRKRGLRIAYVVEPFFNMCFVKNAQTNLSNFAESISDLHSFSKNIHAEIIGSSTDISDVEAILDKIVRFSIDSSLKELSLSKGTLNKRLELYTLIAFLLSKYLYSLVCIEKDFIDMYKPDEYQDLSIPEMNTVFTVYSMVLNMLTNSPSINSIIKNYSAYSLLPVAINS